MHVRAGGVKKTWRLHEQKRWRHGGKRSEADRVLNQQFIPSHFYFFLSDLTDHLAACLLLCLDRHLGLKIIARLTSLDSSVSRHAGGMRVNEPTLSQHRGPLWCDGVRLIPRLWYQVREDVPDTPRLPTENMFTVFSLFDIQTLLCVDLSVKCENKMLW